MARQRYLPTLHLLDHSAGFRCLWALEQLSATRSICYHLKTYQRQNGFAPPELADVFPIGKSPILTLDSLNSEPIPTIQILPGVLTEAQLILRFLNEEFGDGLWTPVNQADRNRDIFFQGFAMMTLVPKIDLPIVFESIVAASPANATAIGVVLSPLAASFRDALGPCFKLLEDALSEEKPWFSGSRFGLADFDVCWGIDLASQRLYIDFEQFPKLGDWHERVTSLSSYKSALTKCNGYNLSTFGL